MQREFNVKKCESWRYVIVAGGSVDKLIGRNPLVLLPFDRIRRASIRLAPDHITSRTSQHRVLIDPLHVRPLLLLLSLYRFLFVYLPFP